MESNGENNGYDKNNDKVRANGAWITKHFLEELVRRNEEDEDVKVLRNEVCAAVGVGDNYLSILYRTTVEFVRKGGDVEKRQLMIKGAPTAKYLKDMIEEIGIFRKESVMYNECLPGMKSLLEEYMPQEKEFIAPASYKCERPDTIVMEDLQVSGYKMAARRDQLDFEHCTRSLESLARFHALSLKLRERNPEIIDAVSYDFYQESNREKMEPYFQQAFPIWCEYIEAWEESSRFAPVVRRLGDHVYDKVLHMVQSGATSVLNHGDSWINNILFRYDDNGRVQHARLVDFQLSRFTSAAMDLIYFLFTSPRPQVLTERMFDLIRSYHRAFISDLEQLGLDTGRFTLEQLHEELKDRSFFALVVMSTVTPIIIAKPADAMDLENFDPENINHQDFPLRNNYKDSYYREVVGKYLKQMDDIGYLREAESRMQPVQEKVAARKAKSAPQLTAGAAMPPEISAN